MKNKAPRLTTFVAKLLDVSLLGSSLVSMFANQAAFDRPESRAAAAGINLSLAQAIADPQGRVLAHARTGGMMNSQRYTLLTGTRLFRFGRSNQLPQEVARGGWWLEAREFERLVSFANAHGIHLGLAMRLLCLVPPEWSDATQLVRARVASSLLAWRGLANTVVTPIAGGLGTLRLPHTNEISERRLHQLYIPGLAEQSPIEPAIAIERVFALDPNTSLEGFLYL